MVIGTVDPEFLSPLSYILCHRASPLVRGHVIWDSMPVDQVIFKPPEGGASEASQAGKATPYLE